MIKNFEYCKYTFLHRLALKYYIEKCKYLTKQDKEELLKRAKVHDMDKMMMYLFWDKQKAHNYHVLHAKHHIKNKDTIERMDILESLFDYECAALTKPDKPLNAYDTVLTYYPDLITLYEPYLKYLHMTSSYIAYNQKDVDFFKQFLDVSEEDILHEISNYLNENSNNIYFLLKDELCSEEDYFKLKNYKILTCD